MFIQVMKCLDYNLLYICIFFFKYVQQFLNVIVFKNTMLVKIVCCEIIDCVIYLCIL